MFEKDVVVDNGIEMDEKQCFLYTNIIRIKGIDFTEDIKNIELKSDELM